MRTTTARWRSGIAALGLALLGACGEDAPSAAKSPPVAPAIAPTAPTPPAAPAAPVPDAAPTAPPTSLAPATPAPGAGPGATAELPAGAVSRWYERRNEGQKLGWIHVVWVPSTWEGKATVRDTTTSVSREARQMMETEDVFESEAVSEIERGEDGALYWQRTTEHEGSARTSTSELTWTGDGYTWTSKVGESGETRRVAADAPVHADVEAMLSARAVAGTLRAGDRFVLRELDLRGRRVRQLPVEVVGPETLTGAGGEVACTKVHVTDAETGADSTWWLARDGAVERFKVLAMETRRVPEDVARKTVKPASFSITTPSVPPLQRVFSAERMLVDVHVRPDADRPLPELPTSPWSRVVSVDGDERRGHVVHVELTAYDAPDAKATFPVADAAFATDLEPTALLCADHPEVRAAAREVVGDTKDARTAVERISAFVHTSLRKQSPAVAEATALEILRERQGDCSEHALLFVALCRAVGIPARRCSGFVCVGSDWGAHAWAEAWVGAWIGVDPTTDDVGTHARYLLFGQPDRAGDRGGVVSARARGRLRFVTRRLDEGDDHVELGGPETWTSVDAASGRARHHLAGIEVRGAPKGWTVSFVGDGRCTVRVPGGGLVSVNAFADQGTRTLDRLGRFVGGADETTFSGAPALRTDGRGRREWWVLSRRRIVHVQVVATRDELDAVCAAAEAALAPTFAPRPKDP